MVRVMNEAELDDTAFLAAVDALKGVSAEEQEAAILELDQRYPGVANRARAMLAFDQKAAEGIRRAEDEGRRIVAEAKAEAKSKAAKVEPTKPVAVEKPPFRDKHGNLYKWINGGYRRVIRFNLPAQPEAEPKLKVTEQVKPRPEVTKIEEAKGEARAVVQAISKAPLSFQHSRNPAGIPSSLDNAIRGIDALGAECRYDVFHDRIIVKGHECGVRGDAHENLENVTLKVRQSVLEKFGFDPSPNFTLDALRIRCLDHIFDPVRDYLDGLRWDGIKRIDTWLIRYCRADDNPLNRAIGRKMLIAGVRRVKEPGCKFDYIVVLEGDQGIGKSSVLKILAGEDNFSDNEILGLHKREQQEAIQGVWIYEVAELEGLVKSEITQVKLFASKTYDSARPAYGRSRVDRPRRCIFVATTNENTYLRDTTGNRRFWPVCVNTIDLDGVKRDRDQLWAEAVWPAPGSEDTELGVLMEPEVGHGETEVYARVQA